MQQVLKTITLINLFTSFFISTLAQHNAERGILNKNELIPAKVAKNDEVNSMQIPATICNGVNTFWGIEYFTNSAYELELTGNVITLTGNIISNCPGYSLAVCNNLNGGLHSPTLYTSLVNKSYYWDGDSTWTLADSSNFSFGNAGGYENDLYFLRNYSDTDYVVKYNGINYSLVYTPLNRLCVADIAVDSAGNFIVLSYSVGSMTDSIYIISPSGQILNQFPFAINLGNDYGSMVLNSVFYIGFGGGSHSLLPVTFTATSAIAGTPIAMPVFTSSFMDLASCLPGSVLSLNSIFFENEFTISPNPSSENITVKIDPNLHSTYTIYSVNGTEVIPSTILNERNTTINISFLKKGIYIVEIRNNKGVLRKKLGKL